MKVDSDTGPAAELIPTLRAVHTLLAESLESLGLKGYFVAAVLLPEVSDREGYDVVRMASNLDESDIASFLQHLGRTADPRPPNPAVKVLSLQQAMALVDTIRSGQGKKGTH